MKLSPAIRYAVRILFELSTARKPLSAGYLSQKTGITPRAIENIHAVLRKHKITFGTVGAKGGIELVRPLSEISLGKLVEIFDSGVSFAVCSGEKANECPGQSTCAVRSAWRDVSRHVQESLDAVSLENILRQYPEGIFGCGRE